MNSDFADAFLEGVRRIVRTASPRSKRDKIDRLAWRPRSDGAPLWQFPDTLAMDSGSGFWQSGIFPELGREMETQMISNALGESQPDAEPDLKKHVRAGCGESAYHTGKRLRANEQDAARKNAPVSKSTGGTLCWDYNPHAWCHSTDCRHVREQMKDTGIHWAVLMQLDRRGGLPGHPIIDPEKVGGYIQAIREENSGFDDGSTSQFVNAGSYQDGNWPIQLEEETKSTEEPMANSNWKCEPLLKGAPFWIIRRSTYNFGDQSDTDEPCRRPS